MKRVAIFLLALTIVSAKANACSTNYSANDKVTKVIQESDGFGFDNYEEVCKKLNNANATLLISGEATVLSNRSIA